MYSVVSLHLFSMGFIEFSSLWVDYFSSILENSQSLSLHILFSSHYLYLFSFYNYIYVKTFRMPHIFLIYIFSYSFFLWALFWIFLYWHVFHSANSVSAFKNIKFQKIYTFYSRLVNWFIFLGVKFTWNSLNFTYLSIFSNIFFNTWLVISSFCLLTQISGLS